MSYPTQSAPGNPYPPPGPPGGAPTPQSAYPGPAIQDTTETFEGLQYRIDHRDSNSLLTFHLQEGYEVKSRPGAMVAQSATIKIQGKLKFSFKKMMTGGQMTESTYTGPGEVLLAPEIWGDIIPIHISPQQEWNVGRDAYLACTTGVVRTSIGQGVKKAIFSGEGFFVYKVSGSGIFFAKSLGAIIQRQLGPDEQLIVDNGHLVAWTCPYEIQRIDATGGFLSKLETGEGFVCRFTGPGVIYIQTRNPDALSEWIAGRAASG